jgi:Cytochrome c7 and related cytochrome c
MMPFSILQRLKIRHRLVLIGVVVVVVLVLAGLSLFAVANTQAAPEQPIAFSHESMVQKGIPCEFCHTGVTKSPVAGIPSVAKCIGCHKTNETNSPEIAKLAAFWERQEPIPWARVNQLPRFVYFSHEVHVVDANLNCERCHGDVGHMTVTRPAVNMNMGFCLSCHEQQPNAKQLTDCLTCHK